MSKGGFWIAKFDWFCNNVYEDGRSEWVRGWTYTVWENKPVKKDLHPQIPGYVWVDPQQEEPIASMNYIFFERLFPELSFDDATEPVYVESFPRAAEPPPVLMWGVLSSHGSGVGEVGIPIEDGYVEPRAQGVNKLCVCFDEMMDTSDIDPRVIAISARSSGRILHPCLVEWYAGRCMIMTLGEALPDRDTYEIVIGPEIKSAAGYSVIENRDITVHALKGDVVPSGKVDTEDLSAFAAYLESPVDYNNARFDIDQNGWIDMRDVYEVLANFGHTRPGE